MKGREKNVYLKQQNLKYATQYLRENKSAPGNKLNLLFVIVRSFFMLIIFVFRHFFGIMKWCVKKISLTTLDWSTFLSRNALFYSFAQLPYFNFLEHCSFPWILINICFDIYFFIFKISYLYSNFLKILPFVILSLVSV